MHWNIEGLKSKIYGNKWEDPEFIKLAKKHDIIAITESQIGNDVNIEMDGYIEKRPRMVRPKPKKAVKHSGGIVCLVKTELANRIEIIKSKSVNIMWVKIRTNRGNSDIMMAITYLSPENSTYSKTHSPDKTWDILRNEIGKYRKDYKISLIGDFNSRTGQLLDYVQNDDNRFVDLPDNYAIDHELCKRTNQDESVNDFGRTLIDLCRMCELRILNGRIFGDTGGKKTCHRWNGSSTVDYMITDTTLFKRVLTFRVIDFLEQLSDHCPISVTIDLELDNNVQRKSESEIGINSPKKVRWSREFENLYKMRLSDANSMSEIQMIEETPLNDKNGIDNAILKLQNSLCKAAALNSLRPKKKGCRKKTIKGKPWFSIELKRTRNSLLRMGRDLVGQCNNHETRENFFRLKRRYKTLVCQAKRNFKQTIYNKLERLESVNPKEYWELFEQLKLEGSGKSVKCPIDDDEWIRHYTKLLGPKCYEQNDIEEIRTKIDVMKNIPSFSELDFEISLKEVNEACKMLKNNKAVGIDQVSNEMVKSALPLIAGILKKIFNAILCNKHYPHEWKKGIIVNLFKSGSVNSTDNYRGLTINSCLAKVFNNVLNMRLTKYVEKNNILSDVQIGFRKKARTSDHLYVVNTLMRKFKHLKKKLFMCFVDFRKAYDSVWREALMYKLLEYDIRGNFYSVIEEMYKGGEACLKNDGYLSEFFQCGRGVRQGDVLSPILFNLYINDIPKLFVEDKDSPMLGNRAIHCLLYADDLILFSQTYNGLQEKLIKLNNYCNKWDLSVNTKKTEVMVLSNDDKYTPAERFNIGGVEINYVNYYKYLGIEVHKNVDMIPSAENLCVRSWKAIFRINTAFRGIDFDPSVKLKMFDKVVRPITCYNSEIWGCFNNLHKSPNQTQFWNRVEKLPWENLQNKFCTNLLGVSKRSTKCAVMGEVGRFPLIIYIVKSMLKFYQHIKDPKNKRPLLDASYQEDSQLPNGLSWINNLKSILKIFDVPFNNNNIEWTIRQTMHRMEQSFLQLWNTKMGSENDESGKLHILRKIKKSFSYEKYLSIVKSAKYRRAFTAIRVAAHKLEIETGRWARKNNGEKLERSERLCTLCKEVGIENIGDEVHAVIQCKSFENEREILFQNINDRFPHFDGLNNQNKLLFLLTIEDKLLNEIARFIHKVLSKERKSLVLPKSIKSKSKKKKPQNKKKSRVISISAK